MCLPHNSDNFIILQPLPWGKSLLAPTFWGFTWPAAIRVLSRRNRENPGNEVDILISFPNGPFERDVILLLLPESIRWKKGDSAWIALSLWRSCSKNFSTTQSCFLSSNWFFECEHSLIEKTDGYNRGRCTKSTAIRPGFETLSRQHGAHAQERFNSIHTGSFPSKSKSSKWKKGSTGMVPVAHLKRFFSVQPVQIHPVMP